jgi:hypothetical protein
MLLQIEVYQFRYTGRRGPHGPWPVLQPDTLARKRHNSQRLKIMHRTEELVKSLTQPDGPDQVLVTTPSTLTFGSQLTSFLVQQTSDEGNRKYPTRLPIDLTLTDEKKITKAIEYSILGAKDTGQFRI